MPRATWTGHLRISLVSCPINLAPATSSAQRVRLHQINPETGNRVRQRLVDEETGEAVERADLVWGYEAEKGEYVTLTREELDAIKVESSRILDLTSFVDRREVDPLYIDTPYFIYPEKNGLEAYRVIAEAMGATKRVGLGRIVLSTREHPIMVEPFEEGLLMTTLRFAGEVRDAAFDFPRERIDPEMTQMAEAILQRLRGHWKPASFRDSHQDALHELIRSKQQGRPVKAGGRDVAAPDNVVDLMAVLKRSLAEQPGRTASGRSVKPAPRGSRKRSEPAKARKPQRQAHRRRA
jgi:DNA end-binding protein Ku